MLKSCFGCRRLGFVDGPPGNLSKVTPEVEKMIVEESTSRTARSSGIWIMLTYIHPFGWRNSVRSFLERLFIVRAAGGVPAGEEITMTYINKSCAQKRRVRIYEFRFTKHSEIWPMG